MRALAFALTFVFFFGLTYAFLGLVDALPNPPESAPAQAPDEAKEPEPVAQDARELPVRIVVADAGIDSKVVNPASTDLDALNAAVDEAAMRWPTSGLLGQNGTVAIFGHSSHLPIVHNHVYKTFNGIEGLRKGAAVSVYSGTTEYRFKVTGVRVASADEDVVELPSDGKHLVLVTCDNFGSKSDRYVVTADFSGAYAL